MTIEEYVRQCNLPRIETEILAAYTLKKKRTDVLRDSNQELLVDQQSFLDSLVARRLKHEPISYITGIREFYGRNFFVGSGALIPRPSTEMLIEETKTYMRKPRMNTVEADEGIVIITRPLNAKDPQTILDIGTGSGCIALTLLHEIPNVRIVGIDISPKALEWAQKNASEHDPQKSVAWNLLTASEAIASLEEPFLIVSNPPYIPEGSTLDADVREYEPESALFAGANGFDVIREILVAAKSSPQCSGLILECRNDQVSSVDETLRS